MKKILFIAITILTLSLVSCSKQVGEGGGEYKPGTVVAPINLSATAAVIREDKIIVSANTSSIATALRTTTDKIVEDAAAGKFYVKGTSVKSIPETQFTKFKTVGQGTGAKFFTFEVIPDITMADTTKVLKGTQEVNYVDAVNNPWTIKINWSVTVTEEQLVAAVTETKFDKDKALEGVAISVKAKPVTHNYKALEITLPEDLYSAFKSLSGSDLLAGAILTDQVKLYVATADKKTTEKVTASPSGNSFYFSTDGTFDDEDGDVSLGVKYDTNKMKDVTFLLNVTPDATKAKDKIVCTYLLGMGTYKVPVTVTVNIVASL